jgi:hypothetical protein
MPKKQRCAAFLLLQFGHEYPQTEKNDAGEGAR